MFLFEVKRLIWSALKIEFFELYFLQPVLGGHPVSSGHLATPRLIQVRLYLFRKAQDNIDLNQMSHRYVSGVLQNDWNDPVDFRSLDRSQRGC